MKTDTAVFEIAQLQFKDILKIDHLRIPSLNLIAIIGESGCGKSSLLKLLNKIQSPCTGTIYFQGQDIKEIDSIKLRRLCPMLGQENLCLDQDIRSNLELALKLNEKELVKTSKLQEMLDLVLLKKSLDQDASILSGGEKQRLALARILLLESKVILLDEALAGLDQKIARKLVKNLKSYAQRQGISIIMVSHAEAIIKDCCDLIIEIKAGSAQQRQRR